MQRNSALTTAFILLLLLLSGTLGAVLWSSAKPAPPVGAEKETWKNELAALALAEERTAAALEELGKAILRSKPPTLQSGERLPLSGAPIPTDLSGLIASLDALRATIESESRRTQELIRSAPAFGGQSLQEIRRRHTTPDWTALDLLEKDWREEPELADRSQYFQTTRDLLRTYGPPSAIYRPKGGILYVYRRHAEGQAGAAWYFRMQDGIVIEFWVEDEEVDSGG